MEQPCAKLSLVILNGISALPGAAGSKQAFLPYCSNFKPHVTAMCKVSQGISRQRQAAACAALCRQGSRQASSAKCLQQGRAI